MINSKYLELKYYLNHLSMFMRGSYGIEERCKTYVGILNNVNDISDDLFKILDVFNWDDTLINPNGSTTSNKFLDELADWFGINRTLKIRYDDPGNYFTGTTTTEVITLKNHALWIYLCLTIIKNNYPGNMLSLDNLYAPDSNKLTNLSNGLYYIQKFGVRYAWKIALNPSGYTGPLSAYLFITNHNSTSATQEDWPTERDITFLKEDIREVIKLFLAGKLTIESLGITYVRNTETTVVTEIGLFYDSTSPSDLMTFYLSGRTINPKFS